MCLARINFVYKNITLKIKHGTQYTRRNKHFSV